MPEPATQEIKTVAIIGVGLIGGSFGLAIQQAGFRGRVFGVSPPPVIHQAIARGAISAGITIEEACDQADLLYLADRVDGIIDVLDLIGPAASRTALITDVGSTKRAIVEKALQAVRSATFVGGHPLAGKEVRGVENADGNLFRGRPYVLTGASRESSVVLAFHRLLEGIGAEIIHMSPEEHDEAVAFTSHLPQLLSTALAQTIAEQNPSAFHNVVGPGLLDMTRLALSSPALWTSILRTNNDHVVRAIDVFISRLTSLRHHLTSEMLVDQFASAAKLAEDIRSKN